MAEFPTPTPSADADKLANALRTRGLFVKMEHWDGHKHIDICIPSLRLYIEVDGINHYIDPSQIVSDLRRDHYSDGDDYSTLHVPNEISDEHREQIANAILRIAQDQPRIRS